MLCITGIQLSADIILTVYSLYTELGRSETVLFSNVNISDVNIEKIFEILRNNKYTSSYYRKENAASPQGTKGSMRNLLNKGLFI